MWLCDSMTATGVCTGKAGLARARSTSMKVPTCQVLGCMADLSAAPKYCQHKRICREHMQAEVLQLPGNIYCRFCFQCGRVEPLACFDGHRKSCRNALHKRKMRQTPTGFSAAAVVPMAPAPGQPAPQLVQLQLHQQQAALQLQQQLAMRQQCLLAHQQHQQHQLAMPSSSGMMQQLAQAAETVAAACSMADRAASILAARGGPSGFVGSAGPQAITLPSNMADQWPAVQPQTSTIFDTMLQHSSRTMSRSASPTAPGVPVGEHAPPPAVKLDDGFNSFLHQLLNDEEDGSPSAAVSDCGSAGEGVPTSPTTASCTPFSSGSANLPRASLDLPLRAAIGQGLAHPSPALSVSGPGTVASQLRPGQSLALPAAAAVHDAHVRPSGVLAGGARTAAAAAAAHMPYSSLGSGSVPPAAGCPAGPTGADPHSSAQTNAQLQAVAVLLMEVQASVAQLTAKLQGTESPAGQGTVACA